MSSLSSMTPNSPPETPVSPPPWADLLEAAEAAAAVAAQQAASSASLAQYARANTEALEELKAHTERLERRLAALEAQHHRVVTRFPVAETPEWDRLWSAIVATVDRWRRERPGLTRAGAFQRVGNALKWEFRLVLAESGAPLAAPDRPALPGATKDPDHAYRRLRLRNLPVLRVEDALRFLATLPPPDDTPVRRVPRRPSARRPDGWGPANGRALRALRAARGFTRPALAAQIYFSVHTVSAWERGARCPSRGAWLQLAKVLGLPAQDLARRCAWHV